MGLLVCCTRRRLPGTDWQQIIFPIGTDVQCNRILNYNSLQVYIVSKNVQRFTAYLSLSWPKNSPTYRELNVYVILTGLGVVIMPFFVVATMMKIGNHSNDGVKIGSKRRVRDPAIEDDCIYANYEEAVNARSGNQRSGKSNLLLSLWKHTMPIGGLLHAISAICFLLPRTLMEAQLISHGLLPRGK